MKTEQEQIEKIVKILLESSKKCFDTDCDSCDKQYEKDCAQYRKATALVQVGYGNVSEYKAEIERLKSHNGFLQCVISHSKDMMDESVKEAQIDVLTKLKCSYGLYYLSAFGVKERMLADILNPMIEELKK